MVTNVSANWLDLIWILENLLAVEVLGACFFFSFTPWYLPWRGRGLNTQVGGDACELNGKKLGARP